jgi:hypothetical protein
MTGRCGTCRFWGDEWEREFASKLTDQLTCMAISKSAELGHEYDDDPSDKAHVFSRDGYGVLMTAADFGCTLWERRGDT